MPATIGQEELLALALAVPGTCQPKEIAYLYQLALEAPIGSQFVELGTYQGRTLVALALAAKQRDAWVVSIDDYSYDQPCSLTSTQHNLAAAGLANCADAPTITLVQGDSRHKPAFIGAIGLLFVDSHHTRKHFDAEMEAWLGHVMVGGIVACHDYGSARWPEITGGGRAWLNNERFERLDLIRRLIAYRRIA